MKQEWSDMSVRSGAAVKPGSTDPHGSVSLTFAQDDPVVPDVRRDHLRPALAPLLIAERTPPLTPTRPGQGRRDLARRTESEVKRQLARELHDSVAQIL